MLMLGFGGFGFAAFSPGQKSRRWSAATGQQHEDEACCQHDEGREMSDHGFVSTKQKSNHRSLAAAARRARRLKRPLQVCGLGQLRNSRSIV
jgi:hypothetical protein